MRFGGCEELGNLSGSPRAEKGRMQRSKLGGIGHGKYDSRDSWQVWRGDGVGSTGWRAKEEILYLVGSEACDNDVYVKTGKMIVEDEDHRRYTRGSMEFCKIIRRSY